MCLSSQLSYLRCTSPPRETSLCCLSEATELFSSLHPCALLARILSLCLLLMSICPLALIKSIIWDDDSRGGQVCRSAFPQFLCHLYIAFKSQFGSIKVMHTFGVNRMTPFQKKVKRNSFRLLTACRIRCCWLQLWPGCLFSPCRCKSFWNWLHPTLSQSRPQRPPARSWTLEGPKTSSDF